MAAVNGNMMIVIVIRDRQELDLITEVVQERITEVLQERVIEDRDVEIHSFFSAESALQFLGLGYSVKTLGAQGRTNVHRHAASDHPIIPDAIIADELINCVGTQFHDKTLKCPRFRKVPNITLSTNSTLKIIKNSPQPLEPMLLNSVRHQISKVTEAAFELFDRGGHAGMAAQHEARIVQSLHLSLQFPNP